METDVAVTEVIIARYKNYTKHRNTFCGKVRKCKLFYRKRGGISPLIRELGTIHHSLSRVDCLS
jgi:hypothetical protein